MKALPQENLLLPYHIHINPAELYLSKSPDMTGLVQMYFHLNANALYADLSQQNYNVLHHHIFQTSSALEHIHLYLLPEPYHDNVQIQNQMQ